jgi:hypothetical protein
LIRKWKAGRGIQDSCVECTVADNRGRLVICTYLFLKGNKVFEGKFDDDPLAWYFFAKGIFCSVSLVLTWELLQVLRGKRT